MEDLESLPMSILRGNYAQNYWKGDPISSVVDTYRERQPGRDVAAARQGVVDKNNANREATFRADRADGIPAKIKQAEAELADLEEQLRLEQIRLNDPSVKAISNAPEVGALNYNLDPNIEYSDFKQEI